MTDDRPSEAFPSLCRLFPLPRVVLFPHAVIPLHIFEPRYRQMTEDALAEPDPLIVMVQLTEPAGKPGLGDPPIERVACVGRIVEHRRLDDGRFHIMLVGLKRVRLVREVAGDRLYRLAEVEALEDDAPSPDDDRLRLELLASFRDVAARLKPGVPELQNLLESTLSLSLLTDLLAHAMGLPWKTGQALLAETSPVRRAEALVDLLRQSLAAEDQPLPRPARPFPPPFSAN
jgi:Lon protease-like protein